MTNAPLLLAMVLVATMSSAQGRGSAPRQASPGAQEIASGWTALAGGHTDEAEAIADRLLQGHGRRHDALDLKIRARVQTGHAPAALDAYEQALRGAPLEDVYLLQPIARGTIEAETHSSDPALRVRALQALAEAGDADAAAKLAEIASTSDAGGADVALAEIGNPAGVARVVKRVATPGVRADVSQDIDALARSGAKDAIPAITAALGPERPTPTRMSAARALGELDARDAIPALKKALQDADPPVRMMAAAALARLGDSSGADLMRTMEASPVGDIRMMAAEASAAGNPTGAWVVTATAALQDPDPTVRLGAAELLIKNGSDPSVALALLNDALRDSNAAMRLAASATLDRLSPAQLITGVPDLRRLLRDPAPKVRISAASALLRLAASLD